MDYDTAKAADFGRSLTGVGLNLLTRDVTGLAAFLADVFGMAAHRVSRDFAIMTYGGPPPTGQVFQLHADHTFARNAALSLVPESGPRGGGIELRLYETDPDIAAARAIAHAEAHGYDCTILRQPTSYPGHGLRECTILCANGYAWVPSARLPLG